MKILSLDSSTESATCAVLDEYKLFGEITFNYRKQHSTILMSMIDRLLKELNTDISSLDGFVVSKGPGSFTGLRIGAAMIKGLSQGTGKPFIGVSSLDALAYNLYCTSGIICPILDALRGNVYTALYDFNNDNLNILSKYMIISIDNLIGLLNRYSRPVYFIGDAMLKFKEKLKSGIRNAHFAPTHLNLVKASSLGELGLKLLISGHQDSLYEFAPFYLRKSQAEREYEKKLESSKND
ncbi:MAG TPA: tRNA (adenosine(37)-N6)-threonylcarbamoyltransferase complex dimerization subunit type 1 TsaB [Clostridium sp.]|jgi:tRNA threonylcarbamoyl adenosine modification protein YeaZ|uniref:tRNA (Adenosine(37)-N6)-threonylcarbamoyltransferase complex dimerization subunit type 1 TsaB n=1 Tax=Clostridium lapidicellarium TaxID=3240931 RepID=A0ABV4DW16_9CLOT|nr:tRNA (adenosine(37)-N6)-threonylcarbamoyltransferase complex dimerization subunit type 1 TsaB [uncultured Clostridium sp.]NLU07943.1 tRNA (adenosine(37)-N6)-threonylcarbamoyltransferase complex dimerization subunit type 1 TsaB [Clostridiales bacterium]HBC96826.1 tRNA (adenosine(37)-N6)-threonylcarbamoyltransferase complex dimerization subunit type 1 TsaB [Clostridium sp.]